MEHVQQREIHKLSSSLDVYVNRENVLDQPADLFLHRELGPWFQLHREKGKKNHKDL